MLQIRQQQAQFQSQPSQVHQSQVPSVRQISPPHGSSSIGIGVGVGSSQGQNQATAVHSNTVQQQVVNNYGQQGLVFWQQLQDPNNHFVKYMVEHIPNFMSLPLPQQLKSMLHAQVRLLRVVLLFSRSFERCL